MAHDNLTRLSQVYLIDHNITEGQFITFSRYAALAFALHCFAESSRAPHTATQVTSDELHINFYFPCDIGRVRWCRTNLMSRKKTVEELYLLILGSRLSPFNYESFIQVPSLLDHRK